MPSSLTPTRMKPAERLTPGELLLEREVARPEVLTRQRAYENSAEGGERLTRYASVHPHSLCLPLSTQSLLIFRAEASLAFDTGVRRVLKFCFVRCRGCAMLEAFDSLGWFLGGLSVKAAVKWEIRWVEGWNVTLRNSEIKVRCLCIVWWFLFAENYSSFGLNFFVQVVRVILKSG